MLLKQKTNKPMLKNSFFTNNLSVRPPQVLKNQTSQKILTDTNTFIKPKINAFGHFSKKNFLKEKPSLKKEPSKNKRKKRILNKLMWQATRNKWLFFDWRQRPLRFRSRCFHKSAKYLKTFLFSSEAILWLQQMTAHHIKNVAWTKDSTQEIQSKKIVDQYFGTIGSDNEKAPLANLLQLRLNEEIQLLDYSHPFFKKDIQIAKQRIKIRRLRERHKSKLSPFFFEPWKKVNVLLTRKQHWLKTTYGRYQNLRLKDRIDFFRTYLGQTMANIYWKKKLNWRRSLTPKERSDFWNTDIPLAKSYLKFNFTHKTGWWYENLVQKIKTPRSVKRFVLYRPKTAFQIHWTQQKMEPWKDALLFRRALYSGFNEDYRKENKFQVLKIKHYLRSKNPRSEKKNVLYKRVTYLLNNFRPRSRIRADKFARIKQVTNKMLNPFYGHLRLRQIQRLVEKSKKIKSQTLSRNEVLLSRLENRLDVVVYRLNLAPSILWARRLIKAGLVFVTPEHSRSLWESMYRGLKKLSFPLKLRDPKNLYARTYWTYTQQNWVEFKFLGQPQKKISYLLQAGDLIQCSVGTNLNHFKTRSWHCRKPIPAHLMVIKKKNYAWNWPTQTLQQQGFKNWEQSSDFTSSAIFLHSPQYRDLNSKDRVKESFVRWAML